MRPGRFIVDDAAGSSESGPDRAETTCFIFYGLPIDFPGIKLSPMVLYAYRLHNLVSRR